MGLELKIEMAHAVDVTLPNGVQQKSTCLFARPAAGRREFQITQLSSWEGRIRDAELATVGVNNLLCCHSHAGIAPYEN